MADPVHRGSCACGDVRFTVVGALPAPDACHCRTCRKVSGHFFVSADVPRDRFAITGSEHLRWFESSAKVRRGFCARCGASMFWDAPARDWIGVAMGAFEGVTGTRIAVHIYASEKGDYYQVDDGTPCHSTVPIAPHHGADAQDG